MISRPKRPASAVLGAAMAVMLWAAPGASAATTTYTVNSSVVSNVAAATRDANTADGVCATANATCTLTAAIEQANALPASAGDDIKIDFAGSIPSSVTLPSSAYRMQTTGASHNGTSNDYLGSGFFFVVNANRPVTIDFGGDVGLTSDNDAGNGVFIVKSTGVTIQGFTNLRGGDSGIVIDRPARDTTIRDGTCTDASSVILETCVGLISGTSGVDIDDLTSISSFRFGVFFDRFKAGDAPISDVTISNSRFENTEQYGDLWFEIDAEVDGVHVSDTTFDSPTADIAAVGIQSSSVIDDLTIDDSTFSATDRYGIFTYANSTTNDLKVTNSLFDGTSWAWVDHGGSTHTNLTFDNVEFRDVYQHVLDFVNASYTGLRVENSEFVDKRANGNTTIWIAQTGTDNIIQDNLFTQSENVGVAHDIWAIYNQASASPATASTGWSFLGNTIDGYRGSSQAPIINHGNGRTVMRRNTYSQDTVGTIVPLQSESQNRWFVSNAASQANGRIQTFRVTAAVGDGTNATLDVAPVTPVLSGNTAPTGPTVALDVYWTADDNAEEFIGTLTGVPIAGATGLTIPTTKTSGLFRLQTHDSAGRSSQYSSPFSFGVDTTPPAAPTVTSCNFMTQALTGTGEPGATLTIENPPPTVLGTTLVAPDGTWSVTLPAMSFAPGDQLTLTLKDVAGNDSAPYVYEACADVTPPDPPVITEINVDGDVVGTGEPGATVTVRDADGNQIGTPVTVNGSGNWILTDPLPCGTTLRATQEDAAGNESGTSNLVDTPACPPPDTIPPLAPAITAIDDDGNLDGTGEPGATVTVRDQDGNVVGTTTVQPDGTWTIAGPLPCGKALTAKQTDAAGNVSPVSGSINTPTCPDTTAPAPPVITEIDDDGDLVGTGEPGATVTVRDQDGNVVGTATVQPNGTWSIDGPLPCGKTLRARQTDAAGNQSNVGGPLTTPACPDTTAPAAPVITGIDGGGNLDGTGEPGATVRVYDQNGNLVDLTTVKPDGTWSIDGPLPCGKTLTAKQMDPAGNVSTVSNSVTTPACADTTPPAAPVVTEIDGDGDLVGTGEPGATVTVRDEDGNVVGTATVQPDGTWSIDGPLPCGKTLRARQTDTAGNGSAASGPITTPACPDTTAPVAPVITGIDGGGDLDGTGEPGATVRVYDQDGKLVDIATVKPDGTWSINGPLPCGKTLTAKQTDAAGNVSAVSAPIATPACKDTTAPAAPTTFGVTADGKGMGTGEAGAVVRIYDADGKVVGQATVNADGTWVVDGPLPCGKRLTATQTDAAGNTSPAGAAFTTPACASTAPVPLSENDIILQCGEIPLALMDVRRGSKSGSGYGRTTIAGVADKKYAGQQVAIRFLGTNRVIGRATVSPTGNFSLRVADGDPRNRLAENRRRYRAEIDGKRSAAMKLTRRFDVSSIVASGSKWTVKARVSRPFTSGATVIVRVLNNCGAGGYQLVDTALVSSTGTVKAEVPAPPAGGFQVVRLESAVPVSSTSKKTSRTFTLPRGIG